MGKHVDFSPALAEGSHPREANREPAYVHHVKGRLRVQAAPLKHDPAAIDRLRGHLATVRGVQNTSGNRLIGSATVEYGESCDLRAVSSAFRACGIEVGGLPTSSKSPAAGTGSGSSWGNVLAAGAAMHLMFDLLVWGLAAARLFAR